MMTLLTGCSSLRDRQILHQAKQIGMAEAGVNLPAVPAECVEHIPHAALISGQELAVLLKRERKQLDKANQHLADCAQAYEQLKTKLETPN